MARDRDVVTVMMRDFVQASVVAVVICIVGLLDGPAWPQTSQSPAETDRHTVSGVVEQLDLSAKKGMLKSSLGKPIFFEIVKPELFKGISVGQRITIQLDEHGRAVKAIESPSIPELPAPTP